jgi:hypothetical protein
MAEITFYGNIKGSTGDGLKINHGAGSGIGFYGSAYGISVPIGEQQDSTFVTNANGTATDQSQLNNTKWESATSASLNGVSASNLEVMPNYLAPLNVRFTHESAVRVQNCKLRIFDRNDITKHASGVATYVYEPRHPATSESVSQLSHRGRSANTWLEFDHVDSSTPVDMVFTNSPGMSGTNSDANDTLPDVGSLGYKTNDGAAHTATRHDWYVGLSAEPSEIGSKTKYGLYFTLEYL